jgi:hypothetical protein
VRITKENFMAAPKIPDRSEEPALQESLDHSPQARVAANSDDAEHDPAAEARDADEDVTAVPARTATPKSNVSSDRVPATDAEPEGSLEKVKTAPLGIEEIENQEEDSKGG